MTCLFRTGEAQLVFFLKAVPYGDMVKGLLILESRVGREKYRVNLLRNSSIILSKNVGYSFKGRCCFLI